MNTGNNSRRRLPLGIQSFEKLREFQAVYVDKTEYVYKLVHDIAPFFLSRPRRFGKKSFAFNSPCILGGKERTV